MAGMIRIAYCTKTNIDYSICESVNTMIPVLFATETCYAIKENNKENSFC